MWLPPPPLNGPASDLTIFAAQAWFELLNPHTPDSFQARVLDLPTLLEELADIATLSGDDERWAPHLQTIADEIQDTCEAEGSYLRREPRLRASILALTASVSAESKTPHLLNERAQIARTIFGDVLVRWKRHAQELASGNGHEKELFLHRLSTLATQVLNRGLEDESLATISADACCSGPVAFVDTITSCVSSNYRTFQCVVALDGKLPDLAALISKSQFVQVGKGRGIRHDDISRNWHVANTGRFFVSRPYSAFSRRMAAEQCLLEISTLLNVQNLYHNSASFRAVAQVLVYDEDKNAYAVEVSPEKHFGLFPRAEYRKLARETHAVVGERLTGRISNALECHTLALNADNPKTALIHLWTALETVTGSMGARATGTRVADRIAPIIAHRRADKIATYLALSVNATVQHMGLSIDSKLLPASRRNFIAPDDILRALTGKRSNPSIMYLFRVCAGSPLLLNRLFTVWQQFHEPRSLAASMARSRKRVEWQISRIYRARNLLVHKGEQSRYMWRLLRNAHYYVSSAISRVLHDLREQPHWTVDTSLVHQGQRYDYLHGQLMKEKGSAVAYADLLLHKARSSDDAVFASPDPASAAATA